MVKPIPKNCPKCSNQLPDFFEKEQITNESSKIIPKEFETKKTKASDKFKGVKAKPVDYKISFDQEKIPLKGEEEYIRFCGVTSVDRTHLFYTNKKLEYLLELTNNLDFIATSILYDCL